MPREVKTLYRDALRGRRNPAKGRVRIGEVTSVVLDEPAVAIIPGLALKLIEPLANLMSLSHQGRAVRGSSGIFESDLIWV
jgi:hypothetical protein